MQPERRLRANRKLEGRACPRCGVPLVFGVPAVVCGECGVAHHAACWDERPGCHACNRVAPAPPPATPGAPPPSALAPPQLRCPACRQPIAADAQICDSCDAVLTPDGEYHGPTHNAPGAVASVVLAVIALVPVLINIVFALLAIVRAREARRAAERNPRLRGASLATTGLVIGVVAVVEWLILVGLKIWAMI